MILAPPPLPSDSSRDPSHNLPSPSPLPPSPELRTCRPSTLRLTVPPVDGAFRPGDYTSDFVSAASRGGRRLPPPVPVAPSPRCTGAPPCAYLRQMIPASSAHCGLPVADVAKDEMSRPDPPRPRQRCTKRWYVLRVVCRRDFIGVYLCACHIFLSITDCCLSADTQGK